MKVIDLSHYYLNSHKILFHYGKIMEDIWKGKENFNPVAIEVHPTAMCNHRCVHCSYKERNEYRTVIAKEVMNGLVDSIIHMGIRAVYFSGGGEPALYPGLTGYIDKLYKNGVECSIITNASCFDKAGLTEIANKLNYIAISLPAVDMGTFKEITGTENLNEVLALPGKIKRIHGENSPVLGARIVLTNKNYKDVGKFLSATKENGFDYALFKIVRDYEGNGQGLKKEEEEFLREELQRYDNIDEKFTNLSLIFKYKELPEFKNKCWVNQYGMIANVSTDGKVYPNIVEIDKPEFCIGDLNEQTLEEMWNSDRHNKVKEMSNLKWSRRECKNCRAMAYNRILNETIDRMPSYFDPFI